MTNSRVVIALVSIGVGALGCNQPTTNAPSAPAAKTPAAPKSFKLSGVVRAVDREASEVTIRHDDIPGLMPKMTMPFRVQDRSLLDDVQPGDKIEGSLRVSGDAFVLTELSIVEAALASDFKVTVENGKASFVERKSKTLEPGQSVPDFSMTTQEGKRLKLSDLRGDVVVLTFIYTRCPLPTFCPALDRKFGELSRLIRAVPARAERVRLLSISFDPEHDTPEALAAHAARLGAKPPLWTFAVMSHEELARVGPLLALTYGPMPNEIVHTLSTAVIDAEGKLARLDTTSNWTPAEFFKIIQTLVLMGK